LNITSNTTVFSNKERQDILSPPDHFLRIELLALVPSSGSEKNTNLAPLARHNSGLASVALASF
jgi:hypothetical protein